MQSDSDNDSFQSAQDAPIAPATDEGNDRFTPEEEADLLAASNKSKSEANTLFAHASYSEAIQTYDRALASCPNYLDYEVAVLKSNVAACQLKLKEWKEAVDAATQSLDCLECLDPTPKQESTKADADHTSSVNISNSTSTDVGQQGGVVEEVDDVTAAKIEALEKSGRSRDEIQKIRIKALLRRAKAREELGGWSSLQGADEDYKQLSTMRELSSMDKTTVQKGLRKILPRLEAAKQQEMGEMMGKLKDLGNGLLKPFGLSTNNFQFTKDENSGGYSMQFNQGNGSR